MTKYERILVTAALPYANGPLHLGHAAGAYLPADVFCRYHRMKGSDVVFICGSDEHGVAILMRAREDGVEPKTIIDRYHEMAERDFAAFGMSFDYYGRTSSKIHHETSQEWFSKLASQGSFVLKTEQQLYDPVAKLFLADRFVVGTCPNPECKNPNAYGDQCEKCGRTLSPSELVDPRSKLSSAKPELRETTHWYLPLGKHAAEIDAWLATKSHWKANVLGQARSWIKGELVDRAMTRDLTWGVPVPEDVAKTAGVDAQGKVLYVWFDAPIGYVSATREWAQKLGDPKRWETYWKREDTRLVHFIGKDNIVFHTIIFPMQMKLHGEYVLPENVPANEFLNLEGEKFSTTRRWAVWLGEALQAFPPDYLRYALLRIMPEKQDADFSWAEFQALVNNELADNLGNFVNRSAQFATKYLGGKVPALTDPSEADRAVLSELATFPERIGKAIDEQRFRDAIQEVMALGRVGNKYFNDAEPWATRTKDPARCANTIHVSLQLAASLSILVEPFLPFTAKRMREVLALTGVGSSEPAGPRGLGWDAAGKPLLAAGHTLGEPSILVRKIEDAEIEAQREKLKKASAQSAPYAPIKPEIVYDDFAKLDLRVGVIVNAEKVKKSQKLIRCDVDLGFETRQVLAGVAEHLSPEDLVGKHVVVVSNLAPRKMVGLESRGMLLMATDRTGKLVPLVADSEPGSTVS
jgi:methionyl-tRNA synthetase